MNNDSMWKYYLGFGLIIPIMAILFMIATGYYVWDLIFLGAMLLCFIPLIGFSLYIWFTGKGYRWINMGIDWSRESELNRDRISTRIGKYLTLSMLIMLLSSMMIMGSVLWFAVLFVISLVVLFYPLATTGRFRNASDPYHRMAKENNQNRLLVISIVFMVTLTSASGVIYNGLSDSNGGMVTITVNDESIIITAPTVDETVAYSDIISIHYVEDFEKGSRVWGFGTSVVKSGTFKNTEFGTYTLASYAKISPCIVISVNGEIIAFNQDSDESTIALYDQIMEHRGQMDTGNYTGGASMTMY